MHATGSINRCTADLKTKSGIQMNPGYDAGCKDWCTGRLNRLIVSPNKAIFIQMMVHAQLCTIVSLPRMCYMRTTVLLGGGCLMLTHTWVQYGGIPSSWWSLCTYLQSCPLITSQCRFTASHLLPFPSLTLSIFKSQPFICRQSEVDIRLFLKIS